VDGRNGVLEGIGLSDGMVVGSIRSTSQPLSRNERPEKPINFRKSRRPKEGFISPDYNKLE